MSNKEITIYDIAENLGLSPSTISRGLKGHFTVSLKTQQKIAAAAAEMGYRSNTFAANLRSQRTNTIGIIVPKLNSYFMSEVIAGIEKVTNEAGYNLIISQSLEKSDKESLNVKTMFNSRVDGLMVSLAGDTTDVSHFNLLIDKGIPVLFFDRVPAEEKFPSITIDNAQAGYTVTRHLLAQGARNIVHITGNQLRNVYAERLKGYKRALEEAGIAYNDNNIIINDLNEKDGIIAAGKILAIGADAVFVSNDNCAASCMNELKRLGVKIPSDIKFAGFNNDMISRNVDPALTTIDYPGFEMGEIAAKNLLEHLAGEHDIYQIPTTILQSNLIVRLSSSGNQDAV
jgi:LacI family transcriptional regulator